ncbi:MFS transporter [Caulobacter sp. CCUG 60055]|uniref:MFS transporter n=1 Tax=Caulobacter sp. CCUG 60055 TaxID=2100090 RepID=UPI001FA7320C|nr:MFS transporter [Caulobacter sp. CCUG 60055]MBQ1543985.1 MFS transporter [Caulobacteraceae bacterium]MCI3180556.1 MFS transporter [Caulobacter sp. CCUG 60055]
MTAVALRRPAPLALVVAAASFGFVVVQLDVTIVNVALVRIGAEFGGGVAGLQWVVDGYTLLFAALLLTAGALGDRFGPKRAFLAGFGLFAAASAACGLANGVVALVAARAVQGAAAAFLVPPSLALLAHACGDDPRRRAKAVGVWTAAGGVSIAAGPVIGGLLIGWLGWRSIFLVNLPVCALGAALTWAFAPEAPGRTDAPRLDVAGAVLATVALLGLTGAVIEGGGAGWGRPLVWALAAGGGLAGAAFVMVQARGRHPMLPLEVFRRPTFSAATAVGIAVNFSYYGMIFVLGLYLQRVLGRSATEAGLAFLPLTATFIVSNLISGWAVGRFGPRRVIAVGGLIGAVGYALLTRLDASSGLADMLPGFALIPGGMGLAVPAMTTALLSSVERARAGVASGVLNTARQAAGAVGVALFGGLVAGDASAVVPGLHAAAWIAAGLLVLAAAIGGLGVRGR